MRKESSEGRRFLKVLAIIGFLALIIAFSSVRGFSQDRWPQDFAVQDAKVLVYQPQLESYKGNKIKGRAAISIQKKDEKDPGRGDQHGRRNPVVPETMD